MKHLLEKKLLSTKQYGFIGGRSTTVQLLSYLDKCVKTIVDAGVVDTIYLDFAKPFDTVPHRWLNGKLNAYGIKENILNWINEFLCDRTQVVRVNGAQSVPAPVASGISQGTVLGPVLFVVYIYDILDSVTFEGFLFADDTKIFHKVTNADRIIRIINKIKDKRNRANYSSIFDKVHKENPNINMATTKQIIHNLIQQNIIVDISRSDNEESFKMVEVKNITHLNNNKNKTNTLDTNTNIKNTVNKSTVNKINSIKDSDINKINDLNANKTDYNNDSLNDIGDYINDKFYNVLQDMIKKEVSESIKNTIPNPDSIIKDSKSINDSTISNNKYSQDIMNFQMKEIERLRNQLNSQRDEILKEISVTNSNNLIHINQTIESQKKDIEFLRSQLVNKDKTIQLLISEKNVCTEE